MTVTDDMIPASERQTSALAALAPGAVAGDPLPAVAMPMHMGLDALVTPFEQDGVPLIAKTFLPGALAPFTFAGAAEAARAAGELGIAPALRAREDATATLLFDRLGDGWRMASVKDLQSENTLATLVAAKKRWHGAPPLTTAIVPMELYQSYLSTCRERAIPVLPATLRMDLEGLTQWVERIAGALDAAGADSVPLHGENVTSNVMLGPGGELRLLDFDRAGMGDPFRDLGAMALDLCVDDEDRAALISLYTGQPATAGELARLKLHGLLDDACWALWALIAETEAPRRGPELYKYAANRLIRFRLHLSTFDMARLLREV